MSLYVPSFSTGGASVTQQTEGYAVANAHLSASTSVRPCDLAGAVTLSQQ